MQLSAVVSVRLSVYVLCLGVRDEGACGGMKEVSKSPKQFFPQDIYTTVWICVQRMFCLCGIDHCSS